MNATIPGKNLLVFAKMLQCLGRIGEDLFFDASDEKTRSAYFCFTLPAAFFESYQLDDPSQNVRCKLLLKSCLAVFRSLERVESCHLRLVAPIEAVAFELHCKMSVKKIFRLDVEESEPLQAVYDKENCLHRIAIRGAMLSNALSNFPTALEEITLGLEDQLLLRSHVDGASAAEALKKPMYTEMSLNPAELDHYEVPRPLSLTVTAKDLRAVASFSERLPQPLALFAEDDGRPLLFALSVYGSFDADFVLATLTNQPETADESSSAPSSSRGTPASNSHQSTSGNSAQSGSVLAGKRARSESSNEVSPAAKKVKREESQPTRTPSQPRLAAPQSAHAVSSGGDDGSSAMLWTKAPQPPSDAMQLDEGDVPDSDDERA